MAQIERTQAARNDQLDIWLFIAEDSIDAADRFLAELNACVQMLAANPLAGAPRSEVTPGARSHPHGNYVILYRPIEGGIRVLRIVHGARDIPRLFE